MRKQGKRWLGALLALCMAVGLLPATVLAGDVAADKLPTEPEAVTMPEQDVSLDAPEVLTALDEPVAQAETAPAQMERRAEAITSQPEAAVLFSAEPRERGYAVTATDPETKEVVSKLYYVITGDAGNTHTMMLVMADAEEYPAKGAVVVDETITITPEGADAPVTYTVTAIGAEAFAGQTGMTQLWLPSTVKEIGSRAFADCDQLRAVGVYDGAGNADPYTLPDIDLIEEATFRGCTRLSSVTIPKSVTAIQSSAFAYCYSLGQDYTDASGRTYGVYFEEGSRLTRIGSFAFLKCIVLENIVLPDGLKEIGQWAFADCAGYRREGGEIVGRTGLRELRFPDSLREIGDNAFRGCVSLEKVSIPAGAEHIDEKAFYSCSQMRELVFRGTGSKELELGSMAFFYCRSLETLELSDNIKVIPQWCFSKSGDHLKELVIPEGVEDIGDYAFNECGVQHLSLPSSLSHIGLLAFGDCLGLESIQWASRPADDPIWLESMAFASCDSLRELTLPRLHISTGDNIFYDCDGLERVALGEGALFVPNSAFRDCDSLQSVRLNAGVERIGEQAFYTCPKLTDVDFDRATALQTIESHAFCRTALTNVALPASLREVGENAFGINRSLLSITVAEGNVDGFYGADGVLYQSTANGQVHLLRYPAGSGNTSFTIPEGVTHIDAYAFCHSEHLETVQFPESLVKIGQSGFSHCIRLQDISTLSSTVERGEFVFDSCPHLTTFTFPDNITAIDLEDVAGAENCTKLVIPAGVSAINASVLVDGVKLTASPFTGLSKLEEIEVEADNPCFTSVDGVVYTKDMTTLVAYPPAKVGEEFVIPEGVTTIAYHAMVGVQHLKHLVIPASVESAYRHSVSGSLTQVDVCREGIVLDNGFGRSGGYREFLYEAHAGLTVRLQGDPTDTAAVSALKSRFQNNGATGLALSQIQVGYFKSVTQTGDKFCENGVVYTLVDPGAKTARVGANPHYAGETVAIPGLVSHDGAEYVITAVETGAFAEAAGLKSAVVMLDVPAQAAAGYFAPGVTVTTRGDLSGFSMVSHTLTYGDALVVNAPAGLADGTVVTLTGPKGAVTAAIRGGVAVFPVDKVLYDAVGSNGAAVNVTLGAGSAESTGSLTLLPKAFTQEYYTTSDLRFRRPYDGTVVCDLVTTDNLERFAAPEDDLAFHLVGTLRHAQADNVLHHPERLELVGRDAKYYTIDPAVTWLCAITPGQLYIKEVDGVLQTPTFTRVWSSEDGMRIRDSGPRGGQFVAYLPTVENGGIVGCETVDVRGYFRYTDDNPYSHEFPDISYIGPEPGAVYHWDFVPSGNGERQEELDNYRFSGSFMPWDPSLVKEDSTLIGHTGENPHLPAYVLGEAEKPGGDAPEIPSSVPTDPALDAPTLPTQDPTPTPTPDPSPSPDPTERPSGGGSSGGGKPSGGSTADPASGTEPASAPSAAVKPASQVFHDVEADSWYESGVTFVVERGLFNGMEEGVFAPGKNMTRAMLMTVLARLDGQETNGGSIWYQKALEWAVKTGISDGTMPERDMTREQLAAMLYRYAHQPQTTGSISGYQDAASVSAYAQDALKWAVERGIIQGKDGGRLDPQGSVTRAEAAAMLMRFCNLAK